MTSCGSYNFAIDKVMNQDCINSRLTGATGSSIWQTRVDTACSYKGSVATSSAEIGAWAIARGMLDLFRTWQRDQFLLQVQQATSSLL